MFVSLFLYSLLVITTIALPSPSPTKESDQINIHSTESTNSTTLSPSPTSLSPCTERYCLPHFFYPTCTSANGRNALLRNVLLHGAGCTCDFNTPDVYKRDDYQYTTGIGIHKLHTIGATFNDARKICNEEGAHLAIIETAVEERILLDLFKRSASNLRNVTNDEQAFIGIHDLFFEGDWVTILGDSIHKNGYTKWSDRWGVQPDNGGGVQNCGTLLKQGGMDDVSCNARFAFFCEIPEIRIAH